MNLLPWGIHDFSIGAVRIKRNGLVEVTPTLITKLICFYPYTIAKLDMGIEQHKVSQMFIESTWVFKRQFIFRKRFQKGKKIWIPCGDRVQPKIIFHLLHHMLDEIILHKPYDKDHTSTEWWKIVKEVNLRWEKEHGYSGQEIRGDIQDQVRFWS